MTRAPGLRVLLAHDLTPAAERAAAWVVGAEWPAATVVRLVSSSAGIGPGLSSFAMLSEARAHAKHVRMMIASAHQRLTVELLDAGLSVETGIVHGRPERALVKDAEGFDADLIVVGARDHGPLSASLLGSVSRAVVESAQCSVLVARGSAVSRTLLACDGSAASRFATTILATWPMFDHVRTLVVGVGSPSPRHGVIVPSDAAPRRAITRTVADTMSELSVAVDAAVDELSSPTRKVEREIRLGDAGREIVAAARAWAADLIAIGAYSEPFLRRLILGSVARTVLDGVRTSVLVARPRTAAARPA